MTRDASRDSLDARVHRHVLVQLIETGSAPSLRALCEALTISEQAADEALRRLHVHHGLVLHPDGEGVWVAHPFSCTPTAFWVESDRGGWWAPCIWCALGIVALVGEPATIHTRLAGEDEPVLFRVADGVVVPPDHIAHFPIPVARAWDNVHRFCASTLVFRDARDVEGWCGRHGYPRGDVQPLSKVYALARRWYGGHLADDWRKWTVDEAGQIFAELGLTHPTWQLPASDGQF